MGQVGGTDRRGRARALAMLLVAVELAAGCATRVEATYREATLARRRGDADVALAAYARVLAADPNHAAAHLYTGYLVDRRGDRDSAIAHYRAALAGRADETDPARSVTVIALNNLAYALAGNGGDLAEADRLVRQALALSGERPGLLDTLAFVLLKRGRPVEARQILERAVELAPDDDAILETLADVCVALGDAGAARHYLREAVASRPASPTRARQLADRLEALERPGVAAIEDTGGVLVGATARPGALVDGGGPRRGAGDGAVTRPATGALLGEPPDLHLVTILPAASSVDRHGTEGTAVSGRVSRARHR